jgi:hypothetical protein
MRIENVNKFAEAAVGCESIQQLQCMMHDAVNALRAEAWYPIEKADEMGVKDGRDVLLCDSQGLWMQGAWMEPLGWFRSESGHLSGITHFKEINPPVLN